MIEIRLPARRFIVLAAYLESIAEQLRDDGHEAEVRLDRTANPDEPVEIRLSPADPEAIERLRRLCANVREVRGTDAPERIAVYGPHAELLATLEL